MSPEPEFCGPVRGRSIDEEDIDDEGEGEVEMGELEICVDWLTDFSAESLR